MTHCPHLNLLLSSDRALLKKYDLIKSSIIFNDSIPYKDKMLYTMQCHACHEFNAGTNFLCLHCSYGGCWEHKHFESHSREHSHPFGINAMNGLLFCFSCEDYIVSYDIMTYNGSLTEEWPLILEKSHIPDQVRREGLYGLVNMGSTCFMSSVLQTLVHDKYVVRDFISQDHITHCSLKDPKLCMSCALDRIISECYGSVSKTNDHGGFLSLLTCVWSINKNYAGYSQQDAHEFLQFVLNQLHNDYVRIHPEDQQQQSHLTNGHGGKSLPGDNNGSKYKRCSCMVHSTFRGTLKSSIVCSECNDNSKTIIEPYMDLSLDIKGKKTLYECLDSFHKKEQLHDFDYHCPHCQTTKDPIKQLTIDKLSPILIFQLKRFEHLMNGNNIKLNDFVEFPLYLEMSNYCHDNTNSKHPDNQHTTNSNILYELVGIIAHQGTVNEGHYTATLKLPSGQWFKFNDSMISLLKEEQVLKEQAYLLFFTVKQINN